MSRKNQGTGEKNKENKKTGSKEVDELAKIALSFETEKKEHDKESLETPSLKQEKTSEKDTLPDLPEIPPPPSIDLKELEHPQYEEDVIPEIEEKEEVKIEDDLEPSITPEPSELETIVPQDSLIKPSSLIESTEPVEEKGHLTTSIQRQKYLAMIKVKDDGTKEPVKFSKSNLTSDRGIIVIDDVHQVVYVWMGSEISFIMRSILSRESHSIVRFGLSVGPFKIGAGFTRRVLEEAFLDTEDGREKVTPFLELFNIPIEWKGPYAVVQVEETSVHVLDHFAEAAESLEAHLEEALLVIEGLTERAEEEKVVDVLRKQREEERRKAKALRDREIMAARVDLLEGAALLSMLQLCPNGSIQRKAEREEGVRSIFLYNETREVIANVKARFDPEGRAVFLESMFPDEDQEVEFLETFGKITKTIGSGGPL